VQATVGRTARQLTTSLADQVATNT